MNNFGKLQTQRIQYPRNVGSHLQTATCAPAAKCGLHCNRYKDCVEYTEPGLESFSNMAMTCTSTFLGTPLTSRARTAPTAGESKLGGLRGLVLLCSHWRRARLGGDIAQRLALRPVTPGSTCPGVLAAPVRVRRSRWCTGKAVKCIRHLGLASRLTGSARPGKADMAACPVLGCICCCSLARVADLQFCQVRVLLPTADSAQRA